MDSENKLGRRKFLAVSGGLTALAASGLNLVSPEQVQASPADWKQLEFFTLKAGYRSNVSSSVVELKDGTLLWATTDPEPTNQISRSISRVTLRRSKDGGRSWVDDQLLAKGNEEFSVYSFSINRLASGRLLHILSRSAGYDRVSGDPNKSLRELLVQYSTDEGKKWSSLQKIDTGERYHGDGLVTEQLRDGRIVFPFCYLTNVNARFAVSAVYSDDEGKTWKRSSSTLTTSGGGYQSGALEPSVVQLADGRLWMLIRAQTGFLWESFSTDRGETWSEATETNFPSSNAPATQLRLKNGDIAVAWNNHVTWSHARQSMVIGLTRDGKTFKGIREVDYEDFSDNPAEIPHHVTYPHLTETNSGDILLTYNKGMWARFNRSTFVRIKPEWITQKESFTDFQDGRLSWHSVNPGPAAKAAVERYVNPSSKGLFLAISQNSKWKDTTGIVKNIPYIVDGKIELVVRAPKGNGHIILSDSLIDPTVADDAVVRIRINNGEVFLGAGEPKRVRKDYGQTEYTYVTHQVKKEIRYPKGYRANEIFNISIDFRGSQNQAKISVNNGEEVELKTEKVFGLTFIGFLVSDGGEVNIKSIQTTGK